MLRSDHQPITKAHTSTSQKRSRSEMCNQRFFGSLMCHQASLKVGIWNLLLTISLNHMAVHAKIPVPNSTTTSFTISSGDRLRLNIRVDKLKG